MSLQTIIIVTYGKMNIKKIYNFIVLLRNEALAHYIFKTYFAHLFWDKIKNNVPRLYFRKKGI